MTAWDHVIDVTQKMILTMKTYDIRGGEDGFFLCFSLIGIFHSDVIGRISIEKGYLSRDSLLDGKIIQITMSNGFEIIIQN